MRSYLYATAGGSLLGLLAAVLVCLPGNPLEGSQRAVVVPGYSWQKVEGSTSEWALVLNGQHVGTFRRDTHEYLPLDLMNRTFGEPTTCPVALPDLDDEDKDDCHCSIGCTCTGKCACQRLKKPCNPQCPCCGPQQPPEPDHTQGAPLFGVEADKILSQPGQPQHWLNGKPVSRDEVMEVLGKGALQDDSQKLRVTVIAPEVERAGVVKDLAASKYAGYYHLQGYEPSHWAVKDVGFVTAGHPTIYVQDPTGKVLHHQDDYTDGLPGFEKALEKVLRVPDPNYDGKKDPDLRKDPLDPSEFLKDLQVKLEQVPPWAWVLVAVALVYVLNTYKKS